MEGAAAVGALASASNALITLCKNIFQYVEIPGEVEQFRLAIENLENSITTTKRLRRVKSGILDRATKEEVDVSIERSEKVLGGICRYIEGCRVDLQTKGSISVKNKLDWMLRGHQSFMARGMTMTGCIQILSIYIGRMDAIKQPDTMTTIREIYPAQQDSLLLAGSPPPYSENPQSTEKLLRPPTARKKRSRVFSVSSQTSLENDSNTTSNLSGMTFSTEKEVVFVSRNSVGSDTETSSIFSFEEQSAARILSVTDLSCGGDYCTNESCLNHVDSNRNNPLMQTKSLDSVATTKESEPVFRTLSAPSAVLPPIRPNSQRRRHKSGFV